MTAIAAYARISQARDGESVGVDRQLREIEEYAAGQGWTVAETYTDNNRSAMTGSRPEYERLLREIRQYDIVLVWSADRLYRRLSELERLVDALGSTRVIALKSGDIDLSSADGKAVARILGALSQRESEKLGERVQAAMRERAMKGEFHGGRQMYGFTAKGEPDEEQLAEIRGWLARLDAGESLAAVLKDTGFSSARSFKRLLRNPRLVGMRYYRGEVVPGTGEPLVDVAQWERVSRRFVETGRGRPPTSLLSGMLFCSTCNDHMRGHARRNNRGEKIARYRCKAGCRQRDQAKVDSFVGDVVVAYLEDAELEVPEPDTADPAEALREELATLGRLVADGTLSAVAYAAAVKPLEARIAEVEAARPAVVGDAARGLLEAGDVRSAWDSAPVGTKRQVLKLLVDKVVIHKGGEDTVDILWR